jgi:S1-C subfamily serine protease
MGLVIDIKQEKDQVIKKLRVGAGSPAAQARLQTGDVITAINGQPVDERHPLVSLLLEHVAGETVTVDILRNGQTFKLN